MRPLYLVLLLTSLYVEVSCKLGHLLFNLAVQAPSRRRGSRESVIDFDAFGNVPKLEEAYCDLDENALPIVAIIFRGNNSSKGEIEEGILLAYGTLPSASSMQQEKGTKNSTEPTLFLPSRSLQRRLGFQMCAPLGSDSQKVLMTGRSGDARSVMRLALQVSLNHTFDFDSSASGKYIAENVGQYLQRTTMGAETLLRTHLFIASADEAHPVSLHSVDAGGNVVDLVAGNAGRHKKIGSEILEDSYRSNLTLIEAKELAKQIINPPAKTRCILEREGGEDGGKEEEEGDTRTSGGSSKSSVDEKVEEKEASEDVLEAWEVWSRLHLDVNFEIVSM
jgi:hypothetical protein